MIGKLAADGAGLFVEADQASALVGVLLVLLGLVLLLALLALFLPWAQARLMGVRAPLPWILGMRIRRTPVSLIIRAWAELRHSGIECRFTAVERLYHENRFRIVEARDLVEIVRQNLPTTAGAETEAVPPQGPWNEMARQLLSEARASRSPSTGLPAEQIVESANRLICLSPDYPGVVPEALECYNRAIQADPACAAAYLGRGDAYAYKKDYDKAIADYTEAIRLDPQSAKAYRERALAHEMSKRLEEAEADYDEAIRIDPEDPISHARRASFLEEHERFEDALADYNEVIRLDPNDLVHRFDRGCVLMELHRYQEAIQDFTEELR